MEDIELLRKKLEELEKENEELKGKLTEEKKKQRFAFPDEIMRRYVHLKDVLWKEGYGRYRKKDTSNADQRLDDLSKLIRSTVFGGGREPDKKISYKTVPNMDDAEYELYIEALDGIMEVLDTVRAKQTRMVVRGIRRVLIAEAVFDITQIIADLGEKELVEEACGEDSRAVFFEIYAWAEEFERKYSEDDDYIGSISMFVTEKLNDLNARKEN